MGCQNCSCKLFFEIIGSILIIILSIPIGIVYLIAIVLPSIIILFILRLIGCKSCLPKVFDFYLYSVFWPYTWLLCWVKIPCTRYKYGQQCYYIGKIKRNHLQNNYNQIVENASLINVSQLNEHHHKAYSGSIDDKKIIRIICISDTHGRHSWFTDNIPNGDILIHGGDITFQGRGGVNSLKSFNKWLKKFNHKYKILIGGNHDRFMPNMDYLLLKDNIFNNCIYLDNNSYTIREFDNFTIFGCGWSPKGSENNAFQQITNDILNINNDKIDILLGHSDMTRFNRYYGNDNKKINNIIDSVKKCNACIHLCGHFHARYGLKVRKKFNNDGTDMLVANCSSLDGRYVPLHPPVVFDVEL